MKNIIFSFDDGGEDFYRVAYPILKKFNLTGTANIISKYIKPEAECDGGNKFMTAENLLELQEGGIEIACHGHNHENTVEDIEKNLDDFAKMGLNLDKMGFASPGSDLTPEKIDTLAPLFRDNRISYARSAYIPDRHGKFMKYLNLFMERSRSKLLFYLLNKRNFIKNIDSLWLPSVGVVSYTTMKQMKYLLRKMPDNTSVIIMFHHIYKKTDSAYGKGAWHWDADLFCELCEYISADKNFRCINNIDLMN